MEKGEKIESPETMMLSVVLAERFPWYNLFVRIIGGESPSLPPCVRCGKCCEEEVCPVGDVVYETSAPPCPGLRYKGGKAICGLVEICRKEELRKLFTVMGFGIGCDSEEGRRTGEG